MAHRILQFPVRNAFATPRSHDSLALDTQDHAHRIAEQVEREIAQQAQRLAAGRAASRIATMPQPSRATRLRRTIAAILRVLTPAPATRR